MEIGVIGIIIIAFLGPLLVYLTRYVVKGRTPTAMRLWFVSVCTYVVYYLLANENILDATIEPYYFALLWPIPAILTFWLVEKTSMAKESPNALFKWILYFIAGVISALIIDILANAAGWYSYNATAVTANLITNPVTGTEVPAMVLLMMGVMMTGVFLICDNIFRWLRQKVRSNASATYLLIGLAFIWGGIIWTIGELAMKPIK
ncbi:MAG TPA: hypothetical protein VGJ92_08070 [Methanocella sp.]